MARDIDNAQKKAEKLQSRGNKAATDKVANASSDLENAQAQWDSQAPYVFETLQSVDETRLNHLRDVLTQFQTHEVDLVEKNRITAEQSLNILLNVETADEIKTFALRTSSGRPKVDRQQSRPNVDRQQSRPSAPVPSTSSPSIAQLEQTESQRSDSGELYDWSIQTFQLTRHSGRPAEAFRREAPRPP